MKPFFPVIELVDRYVIAKLKIEKLNVGSEEFDFYTDQLSGYDLTVIQDELSALYEVHKTIWGLEAELKSGKEAELELAEIGRRAIAIRNWNNKRVALKNAMAEKLGSNIKEVKHDHLSEK
jgi:hypothetical protein